MTRMEGTRGLRARTDVHYNCCQAVLVPFSDVCGLDRETAFRLGGNFGSGMRHGSTCGALSAALLVLGGLGYDEHTAAQLIRRFREAHGATDCATLLKASRDRGELRKDHCDGLVFEMVQALDALSEQSV